MESQTVTETEVTAPKPPVKPTGLMIARRLANELPKESGQKIRATNVFGLFFRVTWWAIETVDGITTRKYVKSKFLKAEVGPDGSLVIEERRN